MSIFRTLDSVPGTIAVPPAAGLISGPLPSTKIRYVFTPGVAAPAVEVETSANPSGAGSVPPTLVVTDPVAMPEQISNAPEQSAKLIIIEGVPDGNALGAGNKPCVASPGATNDGDTAA